MDLTLEQEKDERLKFRAFSMLLHLQMRGKSAGLDWEDLYGALKNLEDPERVELEEGWIAALKEAEEEE